MSEFAIYTGPIITPDPDPLVITADDGRLLFAIRKDGTVEGDGADANEAAQKFAYWFMAMTTQQRTTEAFADMAQTYTGLVLPPTFERTMSDLTRSIGMVEKLEQPLNDEQANRLREQVQRLDQAVVRKWRK